jgi:hypothetical protein
VPSFITVGFVFVEKSSNSGSQNQEINSFSPVSQQLPRVSMGPPTGDLDPDPQVISWQKTKPRTIGILALGDPLPMGIQMGTYEYP